MEPGSVGVVVRPTEAPGRDEKGGLVPPVNEELAARTGAVPGVASVRGSVEGNATVSGKDKRPLGGRGYLNIAANYAPGKGGEDPLDPIAEGRGPAAGDEMALDAKTASAGGYRIGDEVRFAVDGPVLTKKLVGLVDSQDPRVASGGSLALFDTPTAQQLLPAPGGYHELNVKAAPGSSAGEGRGTGGGRAGGDLAGPAGGPAEHAGRDQHPLAPAAFRVRPALGRVRAPPRHPGS
ncbi:hypothetical protein ACWGDE_32945, partial [Streptomyces sp. NPDC054956]